MYADAAAAIDFLCKAFGFAETMRYPMADGRFGHCELVYEGNTLMLASVFEGFGDTPLHLGNVTSTLYCYVDGERVVVLHAFIKKTQATPERHLRLARRRIREVRDG